MNGGTPGRKNICSPEFEGNQSVKGVLLTPGTLRPCLNFLFVCFLLPFPILVFQHFLTFSWFSPGELLICGDEQRPSSSSLIAQRPVGETGCPWTMCQAT